MTVSKPSTILVVIDPTVRDYQALLTDLPASVEILVLDADRDGVAQITEAIAQYRSLQSIHILSHGNRATLHLGTTDLSPTTLDRYSPQLQRWSQSLADNANLLLYGCNVAQDAIGQTFVQQLHRLTGATIAASTNLTGHRSLGGDWRLDYTAGSIAAQSPAQSPAQPIFQPAALAAYPGVLVTFLDETFTGDTVTNSNWSFGIGQGTTSALPFLTARDEDAAPAGGLPGNPGVADPDGSGALRLTNATNNQAAFVLYNQAIPANTGLRIRFSTAAYGGSTPGADGLTFFLIDGNTSPTTAGAFGGSIGYAQRTQAPGLVGGYVGIAFDEFGNFSNPTEGRIGGPGFTADSIAVRGSQANEYEFLTGSGTLPFPLDNPAATSRTDVERQVQVEISQAGLLTVSIDGDRNGNFESNEVVINGFNLVNAENGQVPDTFKFGFAAGTGDATNIHELRALSIEALTAAPETTDGSLAVAPGGTANVTLSATDPDGSIVSYTILTLPAAAQGTLLLRSADGSSTTPVTANQVLTAAEIARLVFQAGSGFTGSSFTYTATDNLGAFDATPGTITLTSSAVPQPPAATDITVIAGPSANTTIPPLSATDPDGSIAAFIVLSIPAADQGTLLLSSPDGSTTTPVTVNQELTPDQVSRLIFQPGPGFSNTSFSYTARDNSGTLDPTPAVVTLNRTQPPVAANVEVPTEANTIGSIPPLSATDPDGTIASFTILTIPPVEQGTVLLRNPDGTSSPITAGQQLTPEQVSQLSFQAGPGFTGTSFSYTATDNLGATDPDAAIVTFSAPGSPVAADVVAELPANGSLSLTGTTGLSATDPNGTIASYTIVTVPEAGQGQLFLGNPSSGGQVVTAGQVLTPDQIGQLVFVSNSGFTGTRFTYTATDNSGLSDLTPAVVSLRLGGPVAPGGGDCAPGVNRRGNNSNNNLRGTNGTDVLRGLAGNDTMRGLGCPDLLAGGAGNDFLFGGNDDDVLRGGLNRDRMFGANGNDQIIGGAGDDRGNGGNGNDFISGRRGNDVLRGRDGNDRGDGGVGNDVLFGQAGADTLSGRAGNDRVIGGSQADFLIGNVGNDVLRGQGGNDTLLGGPGQDVMRGGGGQDTYLYRRPNQGLDRILDFRVDEDVIDISPILSRTGFGSADPFADYIQITQGQGGALVQIDANGDRAGGFRSLVTLAGVAVADVGEGSFVV